MKSYLTIGAVVLIIALLVWAGFGLFNSDEAAVEQSEKTAETTEENEVNEQTSTEPSTDDNTQQETNSADTSTDSSLTVTYSSSGFSPKNLEVKVGQTVKFVNDSSQKMWVASDPHPVHTDFSAFDSLEGVSTGESYSFTFSETGTFDYHNHLRSSFGGKVVVK